jgi:glucosyl-dolichyl phosphate glucuronosyltransferase
LINNRTELLTYNINYILMKIMVELRNDPIVSVVICTFNRAELLKNAIESILDQSLPKKDYEIIIVDNNSHDETLDLLREIQYRISEPEIKIVTEAKQGLGFARNTGVKNAHGKYVAFMDDDAIADREWLETAVHLFNNVKPPPLAMGGPILPFYNSIKPSWFKDDYESRTWGDKSRFLKPFESFSGSNMIFRKEIIDKSRGFDVQVGMKGDYISVGEETALFDNIWSNYGDSIPMFYSPHVIVFHLVEQYKMTVAYQLKRSFAAGQSFYVVNMPKNFRKKLRLIVGLMKSIGKFGGLSLVGLFTHHNIENWAVEMLSPIISNIGMLGSCFGICLSVKQRSG